MDKSLTIQVIMPAKKKKTKFQVTKRQNNAIAYASDIPGVNQTNQRVQPHKKGVFPNKRVLKRIHLHHLGRYPLSKEPRNVPIRTKDHYANPEGMSDHRRNKSMVIFLDNGLDCSNDAKGQGLLFFFHLTRSRERHQHNTRNPDGS